MNDDEEPNAAPAAESPAAERAETAADLPKAAQAPEEIEKDPAEPAAENGRDGPEEEDDAGALEREAARIRALFSAKGAEADFRFARWTRPIAPAFIGLASESVTAMRAGFENAAGLAGVEIVEEDPELGANILVGVVERWADLAEAPGLATLIPDLPELLRLLHAADRSAYRWAAFEPEGGLRAMVVLLRYDDALARLSPSSLALSQAVQTLLYWSEDAFASESPVTMRRGGKALVKSRFIRLLKAAYAEETPAASEDPGLALALAERVRAEAALRREEAAPREAEEAEARPDAAEEAGSEDVAEAAEDAPAQERSPRSRRGRRRRAAAPAEDPLGGDPRPDEEEAADPVDPAEDEREEDPR